MKLIFAIVFLCSSLGARAEIDWRLSIKLIADHEGNVPPEWVERAASEVARANQVMHRSGRGHGFDLIELVTLTGVPQWHDTFVDEIKRAALQDAARAQPGLYAYRENAINVYVVANQDRGMDPFPDAAGDIILMSGRMRSGMLLHACGHFFNLRHTHEGQSFQYSDGSNCGGGFSPCFCDRQFPGDADGTTETAPDNQCYDSSDVIARAAYNLPFVELDAVRQERVENTRLNFMSYRDNPDRITSDQLDFMISDSNTRRRSVATGVTWFVSTDGNDAGSGVRSNSRFQTVGRALSAAGPRDMALFRAGTYTAPQTINQPVTFRASRGDATLVRP
ncbi:MAG: hypothetical protein L0Y58_18475 [Verrucomicrobia subdivision 3 bacterium]|nr:hypothetical protein [Limisphaerales bacterium]